MNAYSPTMANRCALTLALALTGCFRPSGIAATTEATDASTTTAVSTSVADASTTDPGSTGPTPTTGAPELTGSTGTTGSDSTGSTTSTDVTDATSTGTTMQVMPVCGNMMKEDGEECDDPDGNDDSKPCTLECKLAVCGDARHCRSCTPLEECDNGDTEPNDGCTNDCKVDGRLIFATSTFHLGSIGLAQADQECMKTGAIYFPDRTFIAWLSTTNTPIADRLNAGSLPYRLPGLQLVFDDTDQLLQGIIKHPVDQEAAGTAIEGPDSCEAGPLVWTGTSADGKLVTPNCNDWTSTDGQGLAGIAKSQGSQWTNSCVTDCNKGRRLYCIQNDP
jgi:hypothetical protein